MSDLASVVGEIAGAIVAGVGVAILIRYLIWPRLSRPTTLTFGDPIDVPMKKE